MQGCRRSIAWLSLVPVFFGPAAYGLETPHIDQTSASEVPEEGPEEPADARTSTSSGDRAGEAITHGPGGEAITQTPGDEAITQSRVGDGNIVGPGFNARSADGMFKLHIGGIVQFLTRAYVSSDAAATLLLRRARPIIEGTLLGWIDFKLMPDFGENNPRLIDAYLDLNPVPWLRLRAGRFKVPFSGERYVSSHAMAFAERSIANALPPSRDFGAMLWGDVDKVLLWNVGVFSASPQLENLIGTGAPTYFYFAGRAMVSPFRHTLIETLRHLSIGFGATYGHANGNPFTTPTPTEPAPFLESFHSAPENVFFMYGFDPTFTDPTKTTYASGRRYRLSPQLIYRRGPFAMLAAWLLESVTIAHGTDRARVEHQSWIVEARCSLTGDEITKEGIVPRNPLSLSDGGLGAFEIVARYAELHLDDATFPLFADPTVSARRARELGVGINWWMNEYLRASLDYIHTDFRGGAGTGDRTPENAILSMMQLAL
jgi:phosphate-selective porin OprO/OprP